MEILYRVRQKKERGNKEKCNYNRGSVTDMNGKAPGNAAMFSGQRGFSFPDMRSETPGIP